MSFEEAQYAYALLRPIIIALACETGFYVLSILSFATSTYILARKGFKIRAILIMWITTLIMFAASTCHLVLQWIGNMDTILYELRVLAPHQPTGSNDPAAPDNDLAKLIQEIGGLYLPIINFSMSDGIVLWRVWIMWGRSVKVLIFPVLVAVGSTVWASVCISFPKVVVGVIAIYASILVNNVIATTLIAVKTWQHRRLLKSHLNNSENRSQVGSVLALLVESGTLYCVIWIIFLVALHAFYISDDAAWSVFVILPGITVQVAGIYPTAVITLAALQRTTWDMSAGKDTSQNAPLTEMRFVARDTRSGLSSHIFRTWRTSFIAECANALQAYSDRFSWSSRRHTTVNSVSPSDLLSSPRTSPLDLP